MSKIDELGLRARYRLRVGAQNTCAQDCLEMTRTVASEEARATLVEMAQIWERSAATPYNGFSVHSSATSDFLAPTAKSRRSVVDRSAPIPF